MSAIVSKGESYSPDVSDHTIITYQRTGTRGGEKAKGYSEEAKGCSGNNKQKLFKTPVVSSMRLLKSLGDQMATAFRFVFRRKKKKKKPSGKAASSVKSRKFIAPDDSHRSEAIADCIEFINSSSLTRSSSVSANSS